MSPLLDYEVRWVFSDLDGTIMRPDGHVPRSARVAISEARARGHRVILTTGRSDAQITPDVRELGFDGIISGSGWRVELADGTLLIDTELEPALVEHVAGLLDGAGVPYYYETHGGLVSTEGAQPYLVALGDRLERPARENWARHLANFVATREAGAAHPVGITKIVHVEPLGEIAGLLPGRLRSMPPSVPVMPSGWGEILPDDVHKAVAMLAVLDHFGADRDQSVGIGDGLNDIELLTTAAVGIAMGNAAPEVTAVADLMTGDVESDGFAQAFRMLGLI